MFFLFVFLFTTIVIIYSLINTHNHKIMTFKVMKTSMRHHIFHCRHLHHTRRSSSSSPAMKTKSFSLIASIHKCQGRIIQFLSKLAGPRKHQCFMILKQEEESIKNSLQPNVGPKIKLKFNTGFSVRKAVVPEEQQVQHQYLLPPLVSDVKRTIVLDLDETLVHSKSDPPPLNYDFTIQPIFNGVPINFYVLKRPGVDEFLEALSEKYEIVVFTAGLEPYASLLLDVLDPKGLISHRLYRDSCKQLTKTRFAKDLSMIGRDLRNVVIVDDNPRSYTFQHANGIPIKKFVNDVEDRELGKLLGFFERDCDAFEDMRDAVKQYYGGVTAIGKVDRRTSYKIIQPSSSQL